MRNGFRRAASILHLVGSLLQILSLVLLFPLILVFLYWGRRGDGPVMVAAFVIPAAISLALGLLLHRKFNSGALNPAASMLMCAVSWLAVSALGALPFVIGIGSSYLDGYFEAMSGLTTTGITVYLGLDDLPRSILFWRALMQWLGGLGILSCLRGMSIRGSKKQHLF